MSKNFPVVIFDIDGTLSDTRHRLYFIQAPEGEKKHWKEFFEKAIDDKVINHVAQLNKFYYNNDYRVIHCTGRPVQYRDLTTQWMAKNSIDFHDLVMRPDDDMRPDYIAKPEALIRYLEENHISIEQVEAIFEDREEVAEAYSKLGLKVLLIKP